MLLLQTNSHSNSQSSSQGDEKVVNRTGACLRSSPGDMSGRFNLSTSMQENGLPAQWTNPRLWLDPSFVPSLSEIIASKFPFFAPYPTAATTATSRSQNTCYQLIIPPTTLSYEIRCKIGQSFDTASRHITTTNFQVVRRTFSIARASLSREFVSLNSLEP